jgi:hypothetical protein
MTIRDLAGLPIANASAADAAAYETYVREFLSYGANLRALFAAADASPGVPLLQAHAAALHLAFEGAEGFAHAAPYLAKMAGPRASERESAFIAAVDAWSRRDYRAALSLLDALTVRWPADIAAIKWGQYHAFNLGDQEALLRFAERARIVFEGAPYAHGMIAFALEQNHRLQEAEEEGLHASEIAIDDAWAHHAVAHVMETMGRPRDGARWLDHCSHTWDKKGVFIRDHNWWHAALFRIALGREDEALAIYDARLWGAWPEFPQEQIGAVSMLWRLEMRGVDVGDRWRPVAEQARRRAGEHLLAFHDLHYLYALARGGEAGEAENLVRSIEARAEACDPCADIWREAAAPLARASFAFARGDWDEATKGFSRAAPQLQRIGGSHAQRHLFSEALEYSVARIRAGGRAASFK